MSWPTRDQSISATRVARSFGTEQLGETLFRHVDPDQRLKDSNQGMSLLFSSALKSVQTLRVEAFLLLETHVISLELELSCSPKYMQSWRGSTVYYNDTRAQAWSS